jgi:hypothetical protein
MKQIAIAILAFSSLLISCKGKNEVEIEMGKSEIFSQQLINFSSKADFKVTSYEWKIVETDSVFSNESNAGLKFLKKGTYTIQLKAKGRFGKEAIAEKSVVVLPSNGRVRMIWSDTNGARYEISMWANGTKYDGTAYFDSVYYEVMAGPMLMPNTPCSQLTNAPTLNLPGGNYTIFYKYKVNSMSSLFTEGSYTVEMDGNCM